MTASRLATRTRALAVAGVVGLLAAASATLPSQAAPVERLVAAPPAIDRAAEPSRGVGRSVTLLTGDTVRVTDAAAAEPLLALIPADDRNVLARYTDADGHLHVVPVELLRLLGDRLDPRLFDVTGLIEDGYDTRPTLPLIVTYTDAPVDLPGTRVTRTLSSIGGAAVEVDRAGATRLGSALRAAARSAEPLAGIEKIWLDGRLTASLDESVPQIKAPAVWEQGFDGSGVSIAVVDSGIDDSHPDLAGRVTAAEVFSDSSTATDVLGHGTHVASIAAGTGEASDGQYTGVAYGADLLNAKVLDDFGFGLESWVIAGLEWAAVDEDADVVNMSINGGPSDGTDPVSQAVDALAASEDALFVTSAGNFGGYPESIETPATADSALAVGSVDKSDVLSWFSAWGPRLDGTGVKPELVAPGEPITAARAEGSEIGEPVGEDYMVLSGTSMAAPHVSGAAALLLEANPGWGWAELKNALVTNADDIGAGVFQQGGGRVDVQAAVAEHLYSDHATLDLGVLQYPHDDGETSSVDVVLTNGYASTLRATLDVTAASDAGPAPPEMITVDPGAIELEPGESTTVTVTFDAAYGEVGRYGGELLVGIPPTQYLSVPLAYEKEPELVDLTIDVAPFAGADLFDGVVNLLKVDDGTVFEQGAVYDGVDTFSTRVPPGVYSAMFMSAQFFGDEIRLVSVDEPEFQVLEATELTLDSADTVEATVAVDEPAANFETTIGGFRSPDAGELTSEMSFGASGYPSMRAFARATEPVALGHFEFYSKWTLDGEEVWYDLIFPEEGAVPDSMSYTVEEDDVAVLHNEFHADVEGRNYYIGRYFFRPYSFVAFASLYPTPVPLERLEWVSANDTQWAGTILVDGDTAFAGFDQASRTYEPGAERTESWAEQPVHPGFLWVIRDQNFLALNTPPFVDAGGNIGYPAVPFEGTSYDSIDLRLFADGELLAQSSEPYLEVTEAPAGRAHYELELTVAREVDWWRMSTRTDTRWGFWSEASDEPTGVPFLQVDYRAGLDLLNEVDSPTTVQFDAYLLTWDGEMSDAVTDFAAEWSIDDGGTWSDLPVDDLGDGGYEGVVTVPPECYPSCFVSLRVSAADAAGNTIEQEIERAYTARFTHLPPTSEPPTTDPTTEPPTTDPSTTPVPTSTLPDTGAGGSLGLLAVGIGAVVLGGAAVLLARRRLRSGD